MKHALILWSILAFAVVGCGDAGSDDDEPAPDAGMEPAWADLDFDARQAYMAQTVTPEMKPIFAGYDEQSEDVFSCGTCHGSDFTTFAMPSDITPLSGEELGAFTFAGEGRQEATNREGRAGRVGGGG